MFRVTIRPPRVINLNLSLRSTTPLPALFHPTVPLLINHLSRAKRVAHSFSTRVRERFKDRKRKTITTTTTITATTTSTTTSTRRYDDDDDHDNNNDEDEDYDVL
ncbi:hypothetical protein M0802_001395 [Mischocyttarus mexicanus]|nr:hypothetical protein M0802_001395 [Mischocyttarus mexicanus]